MAPSSGWIRPLVASVTRQAALNQIRASGLGQKSHECDRAARKEINGALGRDGVLSAWALWRDVQLVPRLFESLDCLFGTRGQIFSAAYRALLIVLSYSFLYAQLLTFLALDDSKSFIAIVSLLLLFLA